MPTDRRTKDRIVVATAITFLVLYLLFVFSAIYLLVKDRTGDAAVVSVCSVLIIFTGAFWYREQRIK